MERQVSDRYEYNRQWRQSNKERVRERNKKWAESNPERHREIRQKAAFNQRLKRKGITAEQYQKMLSDQNSTCAICESTTVGTGHDWHIDHDHKTGQVRGLLCHHCNTALGHVRDNPDVLLKMIKYLEK